MAITNTEKGTLILTIYGHSFGGKWRTTYGLTFNKPETQFDFTQVLAERHGDKIQSKYLFVQGTSMHQHYIPPKGEPNYSPDKGPIQQTSSDLNEKERQQALDIILDTAQLMGLDVYMRVPKDTDERDQIQYKVTQIHFPVQGVTLKPQK